MECRIGAVLVAQAAGGKKLVMANNADNRMAAMSLKEIMQTEDLDVRENTLFKKLRDY